MSEDNALTDDADGLPPIRFYFDFSSPYAYLAAQRIDALAALYDRAVDWRPILLGIVFRHTKSGPLLDQPLKGPYSRRDLERCARLMGVPLLFPPGFPFNSVAAARAVHWLKQSDEDTARALSKAVFDTAFGEGRDVETPETVIGIAARLGVSGDALRDALAEDAVKQRLRDEVESAIALGVCGAPYFIVDGEPFWGADRLDHMERWLATGGW